MKTSLLFDFTVDKAAKTVLVTREFAASQSLVWDAFTKPEFLDQWWAPEPLKARTKAMSFKVGGQRLYAMVSQDGAELGWQVQKYNSISPISNFKFTSAFADKNGNVDPQWPGSEWDLSFSEKNETTKVEILIRNESLERMEKMLEMGFREGFTATINSLEILLTKLSNK